MKRETKRTTIKDVAALAGVNKATVSVALNAAKSGTHVSEETRKRILAAAQQLNYRSNAIARSLSRQRTDTITLYAGLLNADVPFASTVLVGIQYGCAEYGKDLLLHGRFRDNQKQFNEVTFSELTNGKVDGLILIDPPAPEVMAKLSDSGLAMVTLGTRVPGIPCVAPDEAQGGEQIAAHLAARGHEHVLYRCGIKEAARESQVQRLQAFTAAAKLRGIRVTKLGYTDLARPLQPDELSMIRSKEADKRATAMVCFADYMAYPVLDDCRRLGMDLPGDLAVVGFDGCTAPMRATPRDQLTTICAHWDDAAWKAVEVLSAKLDGKDVPEMTLMPVDLRVGTTS